MRIISIPVRIQKVLSISDTSNLPIIGRWVSIRIDFRPRFFFLLHYDSIIGMRRACGKSTADEVQRQESICQTHKIRVESQVPIGTHLLVPKS